MAGHAQNVDEFIRALRNAKVARKDLTSIITVLSALTVACAKLPLKVVTPAMEFTPRGFTLSVRIVDTIIPQSKNPAKT
jgi:hypothetical protein